MSQSPARKQQLKYLKERVNQLTNKTVTSAANLGYHEFLSMQVFSNQPIDVLQQTLQSLFAILPSASQLLHFRNTNINQYNTKQKQASRQQRRETKMCCQPNVEQLAALKSTNQECVIQGIQRFVEISEALSQLSYKIYQRKYPLDLYKRFRNLYQRINNASNILHQFQFQNQIFVMKRDDLINQQIEFLQNVMLQTNQNTERNDEHQQPITYYSNMDYAQQSERSFTVSQFNAANTYQVQQLRNEVSFLNQLISKNDKQFSQQVQKYNITLFDLRRKIQGYEFQLQKMSYLEDNLREIKTKMQRMKEDKYRDDLIIESMARKLRGYQKQSGNGIFMPQTESSRLRLNTISSNTLTNPIEIRADIDNFKGQLKDWRSQQKQRISNLVSLGLKNSESQPKLGFYNKKSIIRSMNPALTFSSKIYE